MPSNPDKDQELEQEIRLNAFRERKFSVADVIAMEGGGFLKGESPVPRLVQVEIEINNYISNHLHDSTGALQAVLKKWVKAEQGILSQNLDSPLNALVEIIQKINTNQELLYEFVRQVDFQWGNLTGERPYFQMPGQDGHPDDEYTHESVAVQLKQLLETIENESS